MFIFYPDRFSAPSKLLKLEAHAVDTAQLLLGPTVLPEGCFHDQELGSGPKPEEYLSTGGIYSVN